jgi:hypothetical protein
VTLGQLDLVHPGRVALAPLLEPRETRPRPLALQALEEAVEGTIQVDERLLADMRRDLIQPRTLALLQPDQAALQLTQPRALPRQLVPALRLLQAPVVDEPGSANALRKQNTLPLIRIELEPIRLLDDMPSVRGHTTKDRSRGGR